MISYINTTFTLVFNAGTAHLAALRSGLLQRNATWPHRLNIFAPVLPRGHNYNPTTKTLLLSAAGWDPATDAQWPSPRLRRSITNSEEVVVFLFLPASRAYSIQSYWRLGLCIREGKAHILAAEHWDSCNWLCAVDWFVINDVTLSLIGGPEPDQQSGETFNL